MNTSSAGQRLADDEPAARRELLLKVYDAAIGEYRFNVQLAWDRTKFFLLLNSGLIAAGVGLIRIADSSVFMHLFLALFFIFSMLITVCGLDTLSIGKRYYRESVFTKTVVERELGLLKRISGLTDERANLSIAVTDGQRDLRAILFGGAAAEKPTGKMIAPGTVMWSVQTIFWVMILIEFAGAVTSGINIIQPIP